MALVAGIPTRDAREKSVNPSPLSDRDSAIDSDHLTPALAKEFIQRQLNKAKDCSRRYCDALRVSDAHSINWTYLEKQIDLATGFLIQASEAATTQVFLAETANMPPTPDIGAVLADPFLPAPEVVEGKGGAA